MKCSVCGSTENLQSHHVNYEPEMTISICVDCHKTLHPTHGVGHGIGKNKGENTTQKPSNHKLLTIQARVREPLYREAYSLIENGIYMNESELFREAIRKIVMENNNPQRYKEAYDFMQSAIQEKLKREE